MNKKIIWIILVVIIIVVLGWALYTSSLSPFLQNITLMSKSTATTTDTTSSQTVATAPNGTKSTHDTLPALFAQPGSHQCTYESVTESTRTTNNIYIADGKMRAEFRTTANEKTTASLMVYNGGILYVWTEGMPTGMKTSVRTIADIPAVIPTDLTSGAVIGSGLTSVGWDCHDWSKDPSLLTPPSYVKF